MKAHTLLDFKNENQWRRWLEKNGGTKKEAWLLIKKKHSASIGIMYEEALEEALCHGWIDGIVNAHDVEKFMLRFSPRKKGSVWSQANKKRALRLMREGRMTQSGLERINHARQNGQWEKAYTLRAPPAVPEDLKKALSKNREALKHFSEFPPSSKNQYVFWVLDAKRKETREKRIREVVRRSALNKKPGVP